MAGTGIGPQLDFVRACCTEPVRAALGSEDIYGWACDANGASGFGAPEAEFLYAYVRVKRPARVVQVGAGVATAVILRAARDAGYDVNLTAVEPFPSGYLKASASRGDIRLVEAEAQDVPLDQFTSLRSGDLLFVDSTHTVRPDSEVNLLVLEVLPRLSPGVRAHFHDVYLPYDYQRDLLSSALFFWNESTLLHAFLIGNRSWEIRACLSMLHYACPGELAGLLPHYRPARDDDGLLVVGDPEPSHFPASVYLEAVGER